MNEMSYIPCTQIREASSLPYWPKRNASTGFSKTNVCMRVDSLYMRTSPLERATSRQNDTFVFRTGITQISTISSGISMTEARLPRIVKHERVRSVVAIQTDLSCRCSETTCLKEVV